MPAHRERREAVYVKFSDGLVDTNLGLAEINLEQPPNLDDTNGLSLMQLQRALVTFDVNVDGFICQFADSPNPLSLCQIAKLYR